VFERGPSPRPPWRIPLVGNQGGTRARSGLSLAGVGEGAPRRRRGLPPEACQTRFGIWRDHQNNVSKTCFPFSFRSKRCRGVLTVRRMCRVDAPILEACWPMVRRVCMRPEQNASVPCSMAAVEKEKSPSKPSLENGRFGWDEFCDNFFFIPIFFCLQFVLAFFQSRAPLALVVVSTHSPPTTVPSPVTPPPPPKHAHTPCKNVTRKASTLGGQ
jgi:hypothetical protein